MKTDRTGLAEFIDKAKGALEDMRKYGEGKKQTDWGKGCEATFEKCILSAENILAEENAQAVQTRLNDPLRNAIWEYKEEMKHNLAMADTVDDLEKILAKVEWKFWFPKDTQGQGDKVNLPWHIGNTGDDQVMFLDKNKDYAGSVQIRQFQGRGAYDEPRRHACAEYILEAVNNYHPQSPKPVEPLAVLANFHGFWKTEWKRDSDKNLSHIWTVTIELCSYDIRTDGSRTHVFEGNTYPEAESKARAYLSALPESQAQNGLKGWHLCLCGSGKKFRDCCRKLHVFKHGKWVNNPSLTGGQKENHGK